MRYIYIYIKREREREIKRERERNEGKLFISLDEDISPELDREERPLEAATRGWCLEIGEVPGLHKGPFSRTLLICPPNYVLCFFSPATNDRFLLPLSCAC